MTALETLTGEVDDREVVLLHEGPGRACHLYVRLLRPFEMVLLDDAFPNPVKLSAFLASELGYSGACRFLHAHAVPPDSPLWDLNHSGYSPPEATALPATATSPR